jgi:rubredoxin
MDKVFCVHCGYVFGKEGDGGQDVAGIMLETEKHFEKCPQCARPLELSFGEDPASTVEIMQGVDSGNIRRMPIGNQNRHNGFSMDRSGQSSRPGLLFMAVLVVAAVALSQFLRSQPWWTTASLVMQIGIGLGGLVIALALAFAIDRLFRKRA